MSENRDLWDSLRMCEKELKEARLQAISEVFAELDKIIATEENPITYLNGEEGALIKLTDLNKLKQKFGAKP